MTQTAQARPATLALAAVPARRPRRPLGLLAVSAVIAALLALPLVFLLVEAQGAGISTVAGSYSPLTGMLLWNTVRLTAVVTVLCAIIGTGAAWLVERTDLPGRKVWAILLVIRSPFPTSSSASAGAACGRGSRASAARSW